MSLVNQSIIKHNMGLLNLAEELQNVSQACRVMGVFPGIPSIGSRRPRRVAAWRRCCIRIAGVRT